MAWRWARTTRLEDKYGQLRFEPGGNSWPRAWEDRILQAEEESLVTCMACGAAGEQVTIQGWV